MTPAIRTSAQAVGLIAALPVLVFQAAVAMLSTRRRARPDPPGARLCVVVPYPPGERSGGSKAIQGLLEALGRGFHVETVPLHEMTPRAGRVRRLLADWLTHALPIPVHCRPFVLDARAVRARIPPGAPVVVEFLSGAMFLLFGRRPDNFLVLREHEPLCRRIWSERGTATGAARALLPLRAGLAWLAMLAIYRKVDRVVTLTPEDAAFVRRAFPFLARRVTDIPVSLESPAAAPPRAGGGRELIFLGNFYHRPNVDALDWFLRRCAPHLDDGWTLHLCGLDAPLDRAILPETPLRIVRHGFVDEVDAAFGHVRLAIAPVVSGGGVRMKNLALAALGKVIVTTPLGNEGIGFVPGVEAVVEADGAAMAGALRRLAADPGAAAAMGDRARARVRAGFGHDAVLARYRSEVFAAAPAAARAAPSAAAPATASPG